MLLGNFEYLRAQAPHGSFVRKLLDRFEEHGSALDVDTYLPLTESEWGDGLRHVLSAPFTLPHNGAGTFTESTFYPAFLNDLIGAKESITIVSPFKTWGGTGRWVNLLRLVLARGVRVCIVTLPPEDQNGNGIVDRLHELDVTVVLRENTHEKIAIVDGNILWHGSLNILSHNRAHESMLRIEDPTAVQQFLMNFRADVT